MLGTLNFRPGIIVIIEVNPKSLCNSLCESDFNLIGYNLYSLNISALNKRGIIVYVDSCFTSCQIEVANEFTECLFVKINFIKGTTVTLGAFYRSPGSSLVNDQKLLDLLDCLKSVKYDKLLLIGDFNLPNINWSNLTV